MEKQNLEGFEIKTNKQIIKVLISSGQQCCEYAGYMISEDNPEEFIGAELKSVSVIEDKTYNKKIIAKLDEIFDRNTTKADGSVYFDYESGGANFVDFETDKGLFQIAVYNCHNGYYGHSILIKFNDVNIDEYI